MRTFSREGGVGRAAGLVAVEVGIKVVAVAVGAGLVAAAAVPSLPAAIHASLELAMRSPWARWACRAWLSTSMNTKGFVVDPVAWQSCTFRSGRGVGVAGGLVAVEVGITLVAARVGTSAAPAPAGVGVG
jgi:hypothetical protein